MDTKAFVDALMLDLDEQEKKPTSIVATLIVDGQPFSTGIFSLESVQCWQGTFLPTDGSNLDKCPSNGAFLKLSGRNEQLKVLNLRPCKSPYSTHYHFEFEMVS
jgi:hypothetical protein